MEAFELRWPEGQDAWAEQGVLLLVAVSPREGEGGVPCRVLGSIRPGSPFVQAERPDPLPGRVTALLGDIGVPTNLRGYAYLRSALIRAQERPDMLRGLGRRLYPVIAQEHGVSAAAVERAIRHAVAVTWERGGAERCRRLLGRACSCVGDHPSNGEMLCMLADHLSLDAGR